MSDVPLATRATHHRIGIMSLLARVAFMCVVVPVATSMARAQHPGPAVAELDHATWTIRDGAPTGINALAQSADGVLWIGATTGLYQFDGARFEAFEPPAGQTMPSLSVSALLTLPDGGRDCLTARLRHSPAIRPATSGPRPRRVSRGFAETGGSASARRAATRAA
jgi:hypothetical protein